MRKQRISNIFEISSWTPFKKHFTKIAPSTAYWTDLFIEQGQRHNLLSKHSMQFRAINIIGVGWVLLLYLWHSVDIDWMPGLLQESFSTPWISDNPLGIFHKVLELKTQTYECQQSLCSQMLSQSIDKMHLNAEFFPVCTYRIYWHVRDVLIKKPPGLI